MLNLICSTYAIVLCVKYCYIKIPAFSVHVQKTITFFTIEDFTSCKLRWNKQCSLLRFLFLRDVINGSQSSWVIPVSFMKYTFDFKHMNSAGDDSMYHMRIAGGLKIQSPPCCILIFLLRVVFSVFEVGFHVLSTHPPPSLLGPRRSYYPNETRQETSILCAAQNPDVTLL